MTKYCLHSRCFETYSTPPTDHKTKLTVPSQALPISPLLRTLLNTTYTKILPVRLPKRRYMGLGDIVNLHVRSGSGWQSSLRQGSSFWEVVNGCPAWLGIIVKLQSTFLTQAFPHTRKRLSKTSCAGSHEPRLLTQPERHDG